MAEASFSEDGKYYSFISEDGRLKIWDTETNVLKQEYTPDLHLSSPPTCLQWITVSQHKSPKKPQNKSNNDNIQCIALGTSSGKIIIYSVAQAKVETIFEDVKNSGIQNKFLVSLDWHRKYGLYSSNKANKVFEWDMQSGTVRNKYNLNIDGNTKQANMISAIRIIPYKENTAARFIVAASWQTHVWRLHEDATILMNLGHTSSPKALLTVVTHNNKSWLIEGSQNERLLAFWDVTITSDHIPQVNGEDPPNKKKRRKSKTEVITTLSTPMYNFVLEDSPKLIDVCLKDDNGVRFNLAAVTRSGVVHYYEHTLNGSSTKPIKPSVTVHVSSEDARPIPLRCCRLPPSTAAGGADLVLGYELANVMCFERVTPDLKSKTQVLIRGGGGQSKKNKKQKNGEVSKAAPKVKGDPVTYVEPMGGVAVKRPTPGASVEVPMESRLANLTLDKTSRTKSAVNQNLTKLLMQGLHSKDKNIISMVLQRNDMNVALRTVSKLPADYIPQLLDELVNMATKKTSHCHPAATWTTAVVRTHAALLLAAGEGPLATRIGELLAVFTHRRSHLCQLLNLKGRLELTMYQRKNRENMQQDEQAVLEYKDSSSDEDEMEVEGYQSNSGESWDDGKFDSDREHSAEEDCPSSEDDSGQSEDSGGE